MALIGCLGCCVHPHGRMMSIFALILGLGSFLAFYGGTFNCLLMEIDGFLYESEPFVWTDTLDLSKKSRVGLFGYEEYNIGASGQDYKCISYSMEQREEWMDGPFKAARAFAVFANVFIGAGMIGLMVLSCAYVEVFILKIFGWLFIVGAICEALTFLIAASDISGSPHNGRLWWGASLIVLTSLTAFLAGIVTLRLPRSEKQPVVENRPGSKVSLPREHKMPPGTEITKSEIMPNGDTKYITTKWNKGGSKTVTETFE